MSNGINRVTLLGNLGADPELRFTQSGQAVLNMRLATTESWFDKTTNEAKERTDWHSVVVWGRRAEGLAKFLKKGSQILVEGRNQTSEYQDREGNKRWKTEVVANNVVLTGSRSGNGGEHRAPDGPGSPAPSPARRAEPPPAAYGGYGQSPAGIDPTGGFTNDDDLPF